MNILITGTAGRIGRAIYIEMMKSHNLLGIDITPSSTTDVVADIRDTKILSSLCKDMDVVIHSAALHAPHVGLRSDKEFHEINVEATKQLVLNGISRGVKHFVFTSTTALYGYASQSKNITSWITEDTKPQPKSIYHKTKIEAESILENISLESGVPVTVLQMSRCFPEPANLMSIYRLNRGVDARDVAKAHSIAVDKRLNGFIRFIISGKTPFTKGDCHDLFHNCQKTIALKVPELADEFNSRNWKLPQSLDRVYDSTAAQNILNWHPEHGFESVLEMLDNGCFEVLPVH